MCLRMERYQKMFDSKHFLNKKGSLNTSKTPTRELPLIHAFLNREIVVKISDFLSIQGKLVFYSLNGRGSHKPQVLILKDSRGFHVLRGNWISLSEAGKNG